jgi:hypothetical protein
MFSKFLPSSIAICGLLIQFLTRSAVIAAQTLNEPGVDITDDQLNATYTHLTGFEGCASWQIRAIVQAFWDAAAVLNRNEIRGAIDWNSAAATEFLGAPFSQPLYNTIQGS